MSEHLKNDEDSAISSDYLNFSFKNPGPEKIIFGNGEDWVILCVYLLGYYFISFS